jgi:hypothetical protein
LVAIAGMGAPAAAHEVGSVHGFSRARAGRSCSWWCLVMVPGMSPGTLLNTFVQSPSESARGLLWDTKRGFYPEEGDLDLRG